MGLKDFEMTEIVVGSSKGSIAVRL